MKNGVNIASVVAPCQGSDFAPRFWNSMVPAFTMATKVTRLFSLKLTCFFVPLTVRIGTPADVGVTIKIISWYGFLGCITLFAIRVVKSSLPLILIFVFIQFCNYGCSHLCEIGFSTNSSCANGSAFCGVARIVWSCGITSTIDVVSTPNRTIICWALPFSTLFSLTYSPILGSIGFHEQRCIQQFCERVTPALPEGLSFHTGRFWSRLCLCQKGHQITGG